MSYDSETGRCFDCDGRICFCKLDVFWDDDRPEELQMCSKEDNEYYNNRGYEREEYTPIFVCDNCKEPTDVCECPWCRWCGAGIEENVKLNKIKCPIAKCDGIGDEVCVMCKNVHDQRHGL